MFFLFVFDSRALLHTLALFFAGLPFQQPPVKPHVRNGPLAADPSSTPQALSGGQEVTTGASVRGVALALESPTRLDGSPGVAKLCLGSATAFR